MSDKKRLKKKEKKEKKIKLFDEEAGKDKNASSDESEDIYNSYDKNDSFIANT